MVSGILFLLLNITIRLPKEWTIIMFPTYCAFFNKLQSYKYTGFFILKTLEGTNKSSLRYLVNHFYDITTPEINFRDFFSVSFIL